MKLSRIGIDLAKNVFQLHGVDRHGKTLWKRRLSRSVNGATKPYSATRPPDLICLPGSGAGHHCAGSPGSR